MSNIVGLCGRSYHRPGETTSVAPLRGTVWHTSCDWRQAAKRGCTSFILSSILAPGESRPTSMCGGREEPVRFSKRFCGST
eukprot:2340590-Prymnesium_polylepis.1